MNDQPASPAGTPNRVRPGTESAAPLRRPVPEMDDDALRPRRPASGSPQPAAQVDDDVPPRRQRRVADQPADEAAPLPPGSRDDSQNVTAPRRSARSATVADEELNVPDELDAPDEPAKPAAPRGQVGKARLLPGLIPLCALTRLTGLAILRVPIFSQKVHVAGEFFRSFQLRT